MKYEIDIHTDGWSVTMDGAPMDKRPSLTKTN